MKRKSPRDKHRYMAGKKYAHVATRLRDKISHVRPRLPTIEQNVFHYTNAASLIGIIESSELWATRCDFLNDRSEWHHGLDMACEVLASLRGKAKNAALDRTIQRLIQSLVSEEPTNLPFVACFCGSGDLLTQWQHYAEGGGGYCLEFESAALQDWADGHEASLVQIEYDASKQKHLLQSHLSGALKILGDDTKECGDRSELWSLAAEAQLRTIMFPLVMRFKHPAFRGEGEARLIYWLGSAGILDDFLRIRHRSGNGFVVPYLPFSFTDEDWTDEPPEPRANRAMLPIISIRCGPTTDAALGQRGVATLLRRRGYSAPVNVSTVPFRS
jgi:hypothetical protein